ncbi:(2Fe-2S)-binding protein [Ruegeria atlantica]|uniref:(2Fe-2S)-binding protein n=1 Tax=Ruegeria atlantica TaxID=81569 RepID=UPI001C2CB5B2|nr:(2Fe-2S)-binding protein [Ruegeria atlantica]
MTETLKVNGQSYAVEINPHKALSDVLRDDLGLFGVKVSCGEGECGSCTVLVDGQPVTSCLMLGSQAVGREIVTIEGIGTRDALDPVQEAFIEEQGFQCGFCTPGFILAAKHFLEENPNPTKEEAATAMSGNICRCGAHPYIVNAVMNAAKKIQAQKST